MFQSKKPYSAITVTIENLTGECYAHDDLSGLPDLVEVIKIQATGPTEAARAIRKKLKYGTVHRQIRALVVLDGLIQNAGPGFQRSFADEPLLERLRVCGTSALSDPAVRNKCTELFRQWAQYATTPGLERLARLHRELPRRKVAMTQERSKVIRETENPFGDDEEEEEAERARERRAAVAGPSSPSSPSSHAGGHDAWSSMAAAVDKANMMKAPSSASQSAGRHKKSMSMSMSMSMRMGKGKSKSNSKSKSKGRKAFNLEEEKDRIKSAITECSMASTGLMNSLQTINREKERISENATAAEHFETCKTLRRRILRYIHQVESEEWLGSLLHANDELVRALMAFEQLDRSIEADSDSDDELAEQAHRYRMITQKAQQDRATGAHDASRSHDAGPAAGSDAPVPARPLPPAVPARKPPPATGQDADDEDDDDDDDDDPFGDKNVISTPGTERAEPRW
ncbi:hypothetical protein E4U42_004270 [Claviceps africana]|uniref:VHS domain-containing protein n=1 Tax=Claviceps africana TaxID=83212 RepID=A0A8K0J641_9HYPO|nr:hypothetical protein E4U42_004270 [Claviceps africana]